MSNKHPIIPAGTLFVSKETNRKVLIVSDDGMILIVFNIISGELNKIHTRQVTLDYYHDFYERH